MAQAAEMSESRLSRIVNGRVEPREYELKKLRKALGLNPGDAI
jgi:transcriptional regulator with XRE-family HTH domain